MTPWLEKELEDYIVANPYSLKSIMYYPDDEDCIEVLGRQVHCDAGIIDILLWVHSPIHSFIWVVECKAVHETGRAVEQVQRYVESVRHAEYEAEMEYYDGEIRVAPLIIAPSFSDKFAATYNYRIAEAEKTSCGFEFYIANNHQGRHGNSQLIDLLRPAFRRAAVDSKTQEIQNKLRRSDNKRFAFRYLCN